MIKCTATLTLDETYKANICNVGCRVRRCNCNASCNLKSVTVVTSLHQIHDNNVCFLWNSTDVLPFINNKLNWFTNLNTFFII